MKGTPVTVQNILDARDRRAKKQAELIRKYALPVISLTMNIAGEIKRFPMADLALYDCIGLIKSELGEPVEMVKTDDNTGLEALLCYREDPVRLKSVCVQIEESSEIGRLYDLDVINPNGSKLTRPEPRKCIVCGGPVSVCSRSRAHGLDAVKEHTQNILKNYTAERLSELAVNALIEEAMLTPKPGLVDAHDNGSHKDMDVNLLLNSASSLKPYFRKCAELGFSCFDNAEKLKAAGIEAEYVMLSATNGVNTHKGAVYLLGLLVAAVANCSTDGGNPFDTASKLASILNNSERGSHGEKVREKYNNIGPKAEACTGFPTVRFALDSIESGDSRIRTLMKIISVCDDTNLIHRGGIEGLEFAKTQATIALKHNSEAELINYVNFINEEFIRRNLSPGGAADILSSSVFLNMTSILYK